MFSEIFLPASPSWEFVYVLAGAGSGWWCVLAFLPVIQSYSYSREGHGQIVAVIQLLLH